MSESTCSAADVAGVASPGVIEEQPRPLRCVECGRTTPADARGWRAFRADDPRDDAEPELAFFCPACAEREFGSTHAC